MQIRTYEKALRLEANHYFVKELTKSVHDSNRNITMDNWLISIPLADELLKELY